MIAVTMARNRIPPARSRETRSEHNGELPPVHADRIQVEQVLLNLIRNALDAMHETPRPTVRIVVTTSEKSLIVQVIDNGRGATTEELNRMFEPFYTTRPGGLGLGLSISQSIIESYGRRLTATANPEGGLTFQFELPTVD